jgi:hypothetical protein
MNEETTDLFSEQTTVRNPATNYIVTEDSPPTPAFINLHTHGDGPRPGDAPAGARSDSAPRTSEFGTEFESLIFAWQSAFCQHDVCI